MKEHPLIVDRQKARVRLWNEDTQYYITLSFELIEDLNEITQQKEDVPGVEYIKE
jgi:hypothetical protein